MNVVTITLNPAIDTTYVVSGFVTGESFRAKVTHTQAGGKGNNVARILASYGHSVKATGFLGGANGEVIATGLSAEGVAPEYVSISPRNSRICIAIVDEATNVSTEVLESGPEVDDSDYERLGDHLKSIAAGADAIVISGSAPQGSSAESLRLLAETARNLTGYLVIDSSGATLTSLLVGRPDLIKPNMSELRQLAGHEVDDLAADVSDLLADGSLRNVGAALVTAGADGAWLIDRENVLHAHLPQRTIVNPVGSGDAVVAGWLDARSRGRSARDALARACAFGTAAAMEPYAGIVNHIVVDELIAEMELQSVALS